MVSENDEGYIRGFREAMSAVAGTMGWPPEMGPFEVLEAVKELKAQVDKREAYHRRRAAELEEACDLLGPTARQVEGYIDYCLSMSVDPEDHDRAVQAVQVAVVPEVMRLERERDHARDPRNWRAVFSGDEATQEVDTTALTHGNYVTLEGTGQVLFHYQPPEDT